MIDMNSLFSGQRPSSLTQSSPLIGRKLDYSGAGGQEGTSDKPVAENVAAVQRIKEIGFSKWAEELRAKKIEEMREEILAAMGLTEEQLADMSPEARAEIENTIQQTINERLAAGSLDTDRPKGQGLPGTGPAQSPAASGFSTGGTPGPGVAMQPATMSVLIEAQEAYRGSETDRLGNRLGDRSTDQ